MSDFSIEQMEQGDAQGSTVLVVNGDMTIQNAGELRNALLAALSGKEGLLLDMGKATAIDLAGLQLLCAAHRSSIAEKKDFRVCGIDGEAVRSVVRAAGFQRHTGCVQDIHKTCIWAGGEKQWRR